MHWTVRLKIYQVTEDLLSCRNMQKALTLSYSTRSFARHVYLKHMMRWACVQMTSNAQREKIPLTGWMAGEISMFACLSARTIYTMVHLLVGNSAASGILACMLNASDRGRGSFLNPLLCCTFISWYF